MCGFPAAEFHRSKAVLFVPLWAHSVKKLAAEMLTKAQRIYAPRSLERRRKRKMLWTIFVILLVLWLLGLVTSYTLGGFIHILLVVAIAVALIQLIQGRRVV
jgi:hypothetical protein